MDEKVAILLAAEQSRFAVHAVVGSEQLLGLDDGNLRAGQGGVLQEVETCRGHGITG